MIQEAETTWETFWEEGESYARLAYGSRKKPEKFTPEIIYNIVAMGIEKYFMAYFLKHKYMPDNHTLLDLVEAMKNVTDVDTQLEERLRHMNGFQEICTIDSYSRKTPTNEDLDYFIETLKLVSEYIAGKMDS